MNKNNFNDEVESCGEEKPGLGSCLTLEESGMLWLLFSRTLGETILLFGFCLGCNNLFHLN